MDHFDLPLGGLGHPALHTFEDGRHAAGHLLEVVVVLRGQHVQVLLAQVAHALSDQVMQLVVRHVRVAVVLEDPDLVYHLGNGPGNEKEEISVIVKMRSR